MPLTVAEPSPSVTRWPRALVVALAVPVAALTAAPAQAATVPPVNAVHAPLAVDPSQLLLGAPITSEGATITIDGQPYSTGTLAGRISIAVSGDPMNGISWRADFTMASPVNPGQEVDFGQVRVATVKAAVSGGSPSLPPSTPDGLAAFLSFQVERLPGEAEGLLGGAVSLVTDPSLPVIFFKAVAGESFPPDGQLYRLEAPIKLFRAASESSDPEYAGTLEGFDVIVNQSALAGDRRGRVATASASNRPL